MSSAIDEEPPRMGYPVFHTESSMPQPTQQVSMYSMPKPRDFLDFCMYIFVIVWVCFDISWRIFHKAVEIKCTASSDP